MKLKILFSIQIIDCLNNSLMYKNEIIGSVEATVSIE